MSDEQQEQVQRWTMRMIHDNGEYGLVCSPKDTGNWVKYSDYRALKRERDEAKDEAELNLHRVLACGVAATHPDSTLMDREPYAGKWRTQQSNEVRQLRADRDRLQQQVNDARDRLMGDENLTLDQAVTMMLGDMRGRNEKISHLHQQCERMGKVVAAARQNISPSGRGKVITQLYKDGWEAVSRWIMDIHQALSHLDSHPTEAEQQGGGTGGG